MMRMFTDVLAAFQFLTSLPVPWLEYTPETLARSTAFFPIVGVAVGILAWLVHFLLIKHLPSILVAMALVLATMLVTGALHEDGLADAADGFGGGWNRERILAIFKDSRIGSYGALALIVSVGLRVFLLSQIADHRFAGTVICAHVFCRWTALPLGYFLPSARADSGQGARIAGSLTLKTLLLGTVLALAAAYLTHLQFWKPMLASIITTAVTGLYYKRRLQGITGDCFGATNQLTEIAVYLCEVWH